MNALTTLAIAGVLALGAYATNSSLQTGDEKSEKSIQAKTEAAKTEAAKTMPLGQFSLSLSVKDLKASRAFYEKLDFKEVGGKMEQNWIVLQNGTTTIGLFQGMFEGNMMTFNPGWDKDKKTLKKFGDVRAIQSKLKERGVKITLEADADSEGPAHFILADPDGNAIMFDQHVPKPK